jgi:thiaminase
VKHSPYLVPKVFDSKHFKLEMYLFNVWLKAYEEGFDSEPDKGFEEWRELYASWRAADEVKKYVQELESSAAPSVGDPGSRTIQ